MHVAAAARAETTATSQNHAEVKTATAEFWRFYWGELAMVENREVEDAMVHIQQALDTGKPQ